MLAAEAIVITKNALAREARFRALQEQRKQNSLVRAYKKLLPQALEDVCVSITWAAKRGYDHVTVHYNPFLVDVLRNQGYRVDHAGESAMIVHWS